MLENSTYQEADQLAIYTAYLHSAAKKFNLGWLRTNLMNGRVEDLNPGTTRLQVQHPNHSWQFYLTVSWKECSCIPSGLAPSIVNLLSQQAENKCLVSHLWVTERNSFFYLDMEIALLLVCWTRARVILLYSRERHVTLIS